MSEKMYCPKCGEELQVSDDKKTYQTLIEHVDRPNADVPDRKYLFCPNECFGGDGFWDFYGDFYYEGKYSDLETGENYQAIKGDNNE